LIVLPCLASHRLLEEEVAMHYAVARLLLVISMLASSPAARAQETTAALEASPALPSVESGSPPAGPPADEPYDGPPTLFKKAPKVGGYLGPTLAYTRIDNQPGMLAGLEACFLLDHTIAFGLAGNFWATETHGPLAVGGSPQNLRVMYGGGVVRHAFFTDFLVHPSLGALIGAGSGTLVPDTGGHVPRSNTDAFFVMEPQLGLHSNVTRWVRITLQVGYRLTAGVSRFGYDEGTYSGATLGGAIQLGKL
jgi:hypothetical protein